MVGRLLYLFGWYKEKFAQLSSEKYPCTEYYEKEERSQTKASFL